MAAFKRNIRIDQGADYEKRFTWKTGVTPTPVDLTGCSAQMQIRTSVAAATAALELTTENGGITLGGAAGTIDIYISKSQTSALTLRTGVFAIEITMSTGRTRRLIEGQVSVSPELVR